MFSDFTNLFDCAYPTGCRAHRPIHSQCSRQRQHFNHHRGPGIGSSIRPGIPWQFQSTAAQKRINYVYLGQSEYAAQGDIIRRPTSLPSLLPTRLDYCKVRKYVAFPSSNDFFNTIHTHNSQWYCMDYSSAFWSKNTITTFVITSRYLLLPHYISEMVNRQSVLMCA